MSKKKKKKQDKKKKKVVFHDSLEEEFQEAIEQNDAYFEEEEKKQAQQEENKTKEKKTKYDPKLKRLVYVCRILWGIIFGITILGPILQLIYHPDQFNFLELFSPPFVITALIFCYFMNWIGNCKWS